MFPGRQGCEHDPSLRCQLRRTRSVQEMSQVAGMPLRGTRDPPPGDRSRGRPTVAPPEGSCAPHSRTARLLWALTAAATRTTRGAAGGHARPRCGARMRGDCPVLELRSGWEYATGVPLATAERVCRDHSGRDRQPSIACVRATGPARVLIAGGDFTHVQRHSHRILLCDLEAGTHLLSCGAPGHFAKLRCANASSAVARRHVEAASVARGPCAESRRQREYHHPSDPATRLVRWFITQ
jgi:hypothetical protein